jgi:hypothetical protein
LVWSSPFCNSPRGGKAPLGELEQDLERVLEPGNGRLTQLAFDLLL